MPWRVPNHIIRHPEVVIDYGSVKIDRLIDIIISIKEDIPNYLHLNGSVMSVFFYFNGSNILK
jgi:hypothetical protein